MERQVGLEKDNAATRAANYAKQLNMDRGSPIGRISGAPVAPISPVRVSSAAMLGEPVMVDPEEQARLDSAARELGILPPLEEGEANQYSSLEEAEKAAAPVEKVVREVMKHSFTPDVISEKPRLIDFKRVQGIDLIRGVAFVDGFEIKLPDGYAMAYKKDIIDLAVNYVTKQLAEAIADLNLPTGETEAGPSVETTPEVLDEGKEPTEEPKTEEV